MKIEVEFTSNKDELVKALETQKSQALTRVAVLAQKYARENCLVGDGTLRNSIDFEVDEDLAIIGSNVEYAPYVEFGTGIFASKGDGRKSPWSYQDARGEWHRTVGMKPQPFLLPAIEEHSQEYQQLFTEYLER